MVGPVLFDSKTVSFSCGLQVGYIMVHVHKTRRRTDAYIQATTIQDIALMIG